MRIRLENRFSLPRNYKSLNFLNSGKNRMSFPQYLRTSISSTGPKIKFKRSPARISRLEKKFLFIKPQKTKNFGKLQKKVLWVFLLIRRKVALRRMKPKVAIYPLKTLCFCSKLRGGASVFKNSVLEKMHNSKNQRGNLWSHLYFCKHKNTHTAASLTSSQTFSEIRVKHRKEVYLFRCKHPKIYKYIHKHIDSIWKGQGKSLYSSSNLCPENQLCSNLKY